MVLNLSLWTENDKHKSKLNQTYVIPPLCAQCRSNILICSETLLNCWSYWFLARPWAEFIQSLQCDSRLESSLGLISRGNLQTDTRTRTTSRYKAHPVRSCYVTVMKWPILPCCFFVCSLDVLMKRLRDTTVWLNICTRCSLFYKLLYFGQAAYLPWDNEMDKTTIAQDFKRTEAAIWTFQRTSQSGMKLWFARRHERYKKSVHDVL